MRQGFGSRFHAGEAVAHVFQGQNLDPALAGLANELKLFLGGLEHVPIQRVVGHP